MKQLKVRKIETNGNIDCKNIGCIFDDNAIDWNRIEELNWHQQYDYCPKVKFRVAHTDNAVLLQFDVEERDIRAVCDSDNGRSWEDSCVEFFLQPNAEAPLYYNFEFTCAGYKLIGGGDFGTERGRAPMTLHEKVRTWSSLGSTAFGQLYGNYHWQLSAVVPTEALYLSEIKSLKGRKMRANFYKCGDLTPTPHFVSWNKIESEKPQFHLPKYFGEVEFE